MIKLKPLSEILGDSVPKRTQEYMGFGNSEEHGESLPYKGLSSNVPSVPTVPKKKTEGSVAVGAGEAISKRDVSREKRDFEPSHAECGMVKCCDCRHWLKQCRHPTLHKGRWTELDKHRWRRCRGYIAIIRVTLGNF